MEIQKLILNIKFPVTSKLIIILTFYSLLLVLIIVLILNTDIQLVKLIYYFFQAVQLYSFSISLTKRFRRFPKSFPAYYIYIDRVSNKGFRSIGFIFSSIRIYYSLRSLYISKYYYNRFLQLQEFIILVSKDTIRLRLSLKYSLNSYYYSKLFSLNIYISISYIFYTLYSNRIYS